AAPVFARDRAADYQKMVASLRNANIRAELYLGNPKNMGNQLKYADRRNSPCVIIQGSDEKARGEVQVKDLIEGAKAAAAIASNQEWREKRPAQFSCKENESVAKGREVLARHDVRWGQPFGRGGMPGLVPGMHVLFDGEDRGWPGRLTGRRASRFMPGHDEKQKGSERCLRLP